MQSSQFLLLACLVAFSMACALIVLGILALVQSRQKNRNPGFMTINSNDVAFLFDGEELVNASPLGAGMLASVDLKDTDLEKLLSAIEPQFPGFREKLHQLSDLGSFVLCAEAGPSQLTAEWRSGHARIQITEPRSITDPMVMDRITTSNLTDELAVLRAVTSVPSFLAWRQTQDGQITWANQAYLQLAASCDQVDAVKPWPPKALFNADTGSAGENWRSTLHVPGEAKPRWFEITASDLGSDRLFVATDAESIVNAELALREFVQTLTKTFAHLAVGLAVFDKQRKLSLFNPALADLTNLSPEFLTSRPTLVKVLDRLRDKRMIPEPKNYRSWRENLAHLESAAMKGTYEETWSLPSGQTYRVVGRPHPDGAVAFIFEDISAEISSVRRFRLEQELHQSALDSFSDAIAIFSADGILTVSNSAFAQFWSIDPSTSVSGFSIVDATKLWAGFCAPSPVWGDAREFVGAYGERTEWQAELRANSGQRIDCAFVPLTGGATMIKFAVAKTATRSISPAVTEPTLVSELRV